MKQVSLLIIIFLCFQIASQAQSTTLETDVSIVITNESTVNTGNLEYSPAFYENGIIFISNKKLKEVEFQATDIRIQKNTMSIFLSRRDEEGNLKEAEPFAKELTTYLHEGPITFDRTADNIFFTRNNFYNGKKKKAKDGFIKLKIFSAEKTGKNWENIKELPFNDDESDTCHPAVSVDGDKLYFASNRPGGYGGMDIYVVNKEGESWGEPINLGPEINSEEQEVFPFVHADGTLFFASNGRNSLGGLDLFYTTPSESGWIPAINLGDKFNSIEDDFGLILDRDKKNGYFSSNREDGEGEDDIYSFYINASLEEDIFEENANPEPKEKEVLAFIADRISGRELPGVDVTYINMEYLTNTEVITDENGNVIRLQAMDGGNAVTLADEQAAISGTTDGEGSFKLKFEEGSYVINVSKPGYQSKQILFSSIDQREEFLVLLDKSDDCATLLGSVFNPSANSGVSGANIIIQAADEVTTENLTSGVNGEFEYCLQCGRSYTISASKNGKEVTEIVTTPVECGGTQIDLTLDLGSVTPFGEGTVIRLSRIYYNFNDASIRPDAKADLNALVSILNQYDEMQIEIASHTDSRGKDRYNFQLSQRRADKVVAFLVNEGINAERLTPVGYGESQLLNDCNDGVFCSELDHQYNRRTEVRITKTAGDLGVEYVDNPPLSVNGMGKSYKNIDFWVIGGTFSVRENAEEQLNSLQNLGYSGSEIINYPDSPYHAVRIGIYNNYRTARQLADKVDKRHDIHTYVRRSDQ